MPVVADEPTNGQPLTKDQIQNILLDEPLSQGYRPTLPLWFTYTTDTVPQFYLLRDIELMMIHPVVLSRLNYFKSGIAGAEFDVASENAEVEQFVMAQCQRYWDRGVPKIQGGYEYGWIGNEATYTEEHGPMAWDDFIQFSPRDVFLLTRDAKPVGVRVKQIRAPLGQSAPPSEVVKNQGTVDLWMASKDVPAKGVWYAHNPRYSQFYGQSQLLGSWRPWRRLAWKDGAEQNADMGFYRFFVPGPVVGYPEEEVQVKAGTTATTVDSQGNPRRFAKDYARQICEWFKSGAGVGLPTSKYPADMGGGDKWSLTLPKSTLNVTGGIEYIKHLWDQISYGIGVPPELFEAAESGSGYSGRAIPLESFLTLQQHIADALLILFMDQILKPLVRWNWGEVKWTAKVKSLLQMKRQAQQGQTPGLNAQGQRPVQDDTSDYQNRFPGRPLVPGQREQGIAPQANGTPTNAVGGFSVKDVDSERVSDIVCRVLQRRAA